MGNTLFLTSALRVMPFLPMMVSYCLVKAHNFSSYTAFLATAIIFLIVIFPCQNFMFVFDKSREKKCILRNGTMRFS